MKKLALTIVCALAITGAAFAQGYVNWTVPTGDVTFETNSTVYSPLFPAFGGGNSTGSGTIGLTESANVGFYYELLTSTTDNYSDANVWDGTWTGAAGNFGADMTGHNSTGLTHGGVAVNTVNGQSGTGVQVNWANGTTQSVVLVGWSANLGTSWGGVTGVSNLLYQLSIGNPTPLANQLNGQMGFFGETAFGTVNPAASTPGNILFASSSTPTATGTPIFSLNTPLYLLPVPEPTTIALAGLGGLSLLLFRRRKV
jgi:hypothetical protein